jgi:hypothetical protein
VESISLSLSLSNIKAGSILPIFSSVLTGGALLSDVSGGVLADSESKIVSFCLCNK